MKRIISITMVMITTWSRNLTPMKPVIRTSPIIIITMTMITMIITTHRESDVFTPALITVSAITTPIILICTGTLTRRHIGE